MFRFTKKWRLSRRLLLASCLLFMFVFLSVIGGQFEWGQQNIARQGNSVSFWIIESFTFIIAISLFVFSIYQSRKE
jgi:hypothetical protein